MADLSGSAPRRRFWGWGIEGAGPSAAQQDAIRGVLEARFGTSLSPVPEPRLEDVNLPAPRVSAPESLSEICSAGPHDRAGHTYGKSYRDSVRGVRGEFPNPPDLVAFPRDEAEVASLLDWASDARLAAIPYGGGSSVVGGVEGPVGDDWRGVLTIDLGRLGPTSSAPHGRSSIVTRIITALSTAIALGVLAGTAIGVAAQGPMLA
jgi:alkyldihydroxyacetonephosphate synthase